LATAAGKTMSFSPPSRTGSSSALTATLIPKPSFMAFRHLHGVRADSSLVTLRRRRGGSHPGIRCVLQSH
jgi:hypothetical protein